MSLGFPTLARAGVAAGLAVACLALNAASASAATDGVRSQEWWLQALHVTQAWHSTRASGVTVAVLDTGVDPNQADLRGAVTTGPDYTHSGRTRGGPFWGIHGTALASLIAGRGHGTNAGDGMMGVAPAANILSVRVTLESNDPLLSDANVGGGLPDAIARGIRYAVNHHASVIDLPLDPVTVPGSPGVGGSSAEKAAVAYALAHHVVLVAPAGDEGAGADPVNFPASYKGVISVGAFDSQFSKASFSSHRPYVTLTGAGVGVIAASGPTGYAQLNSTAAASAVVTGVAALIRAQFPSLSPAQVTKALTESARFKHPAGQLDGSGAGTVDAALALAAAARMGEAVPSAGSSPVAASPGAQPAGAPAAHTSSNLSRTLLIDVGIAVAIFLLLAVPILTYGLRRRRRARAARLAEVRAAAQPAPPRKPATTRHAAIDTVEPDQYNYIPAPPNQGATATPSRPAAAFPPTASPPGPSPAPSSPAASSPAAPSPAAFSAAGPSPAGSSSPGSSPAGSSPAMGAGKGANGTGAHPPWATWGGQPGPPGSGPPPRAIPGSAFPPPGDQGLPTNPPGPPGQSAPGGSAPGGMAALMGLAGQTGPGDQTDSDDQTGPGDQAGQAGRRGGGELPLPKRIIGQTGASRRAAPTGPAEVDPAQAGPGAGGIPGWNIPGVGAGAGPDPAAPGIPAGRPGGAQRPGASRAPKVTGSPPWEPAQEPAGEIPWGQSGMPQAGARTLPTGPQRPEVPMPETPASGRPELAPEPGLSPWDAMAEEAWPGGPHVSRPPGQSAREQGSGPGRGSRGGRSTDTGSHPIYVWNPGAATENLPVLPPPGENNKQ